jgi:MFS superfamily sulfate permease-like transporter
VSESVEIAGQAAAPVIAAAPRNAAATARFLLREAAGGLGDLGTFVPIAVGMVQIVGLDAGAILVFAGLANIFTGFAFGIPMAVQPMKAICAVAISGGLTVSQTAIAGLGTAACMLLLGAFGLVRRLAQATPDSVLRALQAAVAAQLIWSGISFAFARFQPGGSGSLLGPSGLLVVNGALLVTVLGRRRLEWVAVGLLLLGLVGAALSENSLLHAPVFSFWQPRWALRDFSGLAGLWLGALPQLPLTFLNSVLAVSALAGQLFPERRPRTAPARVAISVGLMNFFACPFGGMPLCHGSGGLAGQYRLGARTQLSVILLGASKLILGLCFAGLAVAWMRAFPKPILGIFLLLAGFSLAQASRFWETRERLAVAAVMVGVLAATNLLVAGFAAGCVACLTMRSWGKKEKAS